MPSRPSLPPDAIRTALLVRWLELTREVLPSMADRWEWPVRLDHCFMRICLDAALGQRWDRVVRRPAIHHLTNAQLAAAVSTAEGIVLDPASLPGLNQASLRARGKLPLRPAERRRTVSGGGG